MKLFLKTITIQTLIIIVVGIFPYLLWGTNFKLELFSAFILSLINVIIGYILVIKFHNSENFTFYKNIYGGMLLRMIFILSFSLYMIYNGFLQTVPFILSLMLFYILHQWTEISIWLKVLPSSSKRIKVN